jgi:hypothetical protein
MLGFQRLTPKAVASVDMDRAGAGGSRCRGLPGERGGGEGKGVVFVAPPRSIEGGFDQHRLGL